MVPFSFIVSMLCIFASNWLWLLGYMRRVRLYGEDGGSVHWEGFFSSFGMWVWLFQKISKESYIMKIFVVLDWLEIRLEITLYKMINPTHICFAVRNDEELGKLVKGVTIAYDEILPNPKNVYFFGEFEDKDYTHLREYLECLHQSKEF